jgi:sterol carrier protein 2
MTKFIKPRGQVDYPEMGFEAGVKALSDAGINYDEVDQGVACYAYGDSTCGQRVFYQFGMYYLYTAAPASSVSYPPKLRKLR